MSKLLQRLSDASRSGVYRTSRTDEILDATRGSALHVARIDLGGGILGGAQAPFLRRVPGRACGAA